MRQNIRMMAESLKKGTAQEESGRHRIMPGCFRMKPGTPPGRRRELTKEAERVTDDQGISVRMT
ncbi:hypothetical protein CKQ54_20485 [Rahnella variigena]|uniref:Uncharacterized protein n=1 Tax=Rahnella variigena TaxID=574964 RepID=A0ABX9Q180_9GAMM|nr:hypothetical protein D6D38_17110 [Rahnella variigena]RKF70600.1 hypothetical protein CKQ54_20485 [Rahnella variigena]